jgi:hypothetical protein
MRVSVAAIRDWALLALALLVLNFALTFHNVWPTWWITTRHELSIEIAVLLLALTLYARFVGALSPRMLTGIALLLTFMAVGRYAEVTAPALYGRAVNLYWDAQYLPHVAAMLAEVSHPIRVIALIATCLALLVVVFVVLRLALKRVVSTLASPPGRRVLGAGVAVLIGVYAIGYTSLPLHTLRYFSLPVVHTYWQQAEFIAAALSDTAAAEMLSTAEPLEQFTLSRLEGADVIVQFVESYGATAFDAPEIASVVEPGRTDFAAAVAATNRRVASAFVESPTFGGASWFAHSSFMTGLDVRDRGAYDLLLTQDRTTLARGFAAEGYRPVALMPGLRNEWPEGAFYGFAAIYGARALAYQGPEFGWWRIPDQYSLARLTEQEMKPAPRQPLFVFFATISTHVPFRPVPPYQPDWQRMLSLEPYDAAPLDASLALLPEWTNMRPAYADALEYTFSYLGGFLRAHADARAVWIIIGDHQPAASVSGEGARWDVPVHVVSSNATIIEALLERGFREGLTPANATLAPMHELPALLLEAFTE